MFLRLGTILAGCRAYFRERCPTTYSWLDRPPYRTKERAIFFSELLFCRAGQPQHQPSTRSVALQRTLPLQGESLDQVFRDWFDWDPGHRPDRLASYVGKSSACINRVPNRIHKCSTKVLLRLVGAGKRSMCLFERASQLDNRDRTLSVDIK